ncbi:adenosine deaminase [bacterium]|nr:MAG: adenosine deaminase [bacterium]
MNSRAVAAIALLSLTVCAQADERGAERAFLKAKRTEPELMAFLAKMPKGGDLHNHAGGAVYSDYALDAAVKKGLFFDPVTVTFTDDATKIPAARLLQDDALRYKWLNAASMRGWMGGGQSGHDHFFGTFGISGSGRRAIIEEDYLREIIGRAKRQNLQYMELMYGTSPGAAESEYYRDLPSSADMEKALDTLRPRLQKLLAATRPHLDAREKLASVIGQNSFTGADEPLTVRWIYSIGRLSSDDEFFAQAAAGIFLAANEPRVVAMNMVAPEDHPIARTHFETQMRMIDFLWRNLGKPNLTLHGGELTPSISPPEAMSDRIRKTIEIGHARRIGHGVSIAWEEGLDELLAKMKREGIAVEICLSSNATILGVSGDRHPFRLYRQAGVPVFLNTDDEGVSRSTMTLEWVRAVREQGADYKELKELARNSIEYSFLPGRSLFEGRDYRRLAAPFRDARNPGWTPNDEAKRLLVHSEKMRVQLRLERAFVDFEAKFR